ncbi:MULTISPECIES: hypothetical protein [Saccharibacillus]|uniref:hypothetical protein n=1 Tax=Saccharibacillus TaxID=456492 RepID=UPI001239D0AE|nr:hypothetical protein [Saccharibacillus sp. WB 17]MWJ30103.1 hypothetical protein [Saccharibacillus sp. WB 17]
MLFAQHGYGKSTKIDRAMSGGFISGVVLSPKDESESNLRSCVQAIHLNHPSAEVMLDPQFYHVPFVNANDRNLTTYPYYPGHLSLSSFRGRQLQPLVERVMDYQESLDTTYLVSPCILINSFTDRETQIVLNMAQEAIDYNSTLGNGKELLISLLISENAFSDLAQLNQFLNEISVLDVHGFYVTISRNSTAYNQNFDTPSTLTNILTFIYSLSEINMYKVIMGYSDFVGIMYLSVGAYSIATGWHNGLRRFTVQQRVLPSTGGRQPRHRYSCWPLFNTLLLTELDSVSDVTGLLPRIMSNTSYDSRITQATYPSSALWDKDGGHMQHWEALKNAIDSIITPYSDVTSRLDTLMSAIVNAQGLYVLMNQRYVPLEVSSSEMHLSVWEEAITNFRIQANV